MLTVSEEFLLLTAEDPDAEGTRAVVRLPESRLGIRAAMAGAALMELALRDRIDTDLDRLWLLDPTPTGEAAVDPTLARLVAMPEAELSRRSITENMEPLGSDCYALARQSLEARGLVRPETGRVMLVFRETRYVVADLERLRSIRKRVHDVLLEGELPDPRDVCLISLLDSTQMFRRVVAEERMEEARTQARRYVNMDLVGRNVARHVALLRELLVRHAADV